MLRIQNSQEGQEGQSWTVEVINETTKKDEIQSEAPEEVVVDSITTVVMQGEEDLVVEE